MYARSHIYFTKEITGSKNPYLLFGSLFPDFHQTNCLPQGFDKQVIDLTIPKDQQTVSQTLKISKNAKEDIHIYAIYTVEDGDFVEVNSNPSMIIRR